MKKSWGLLFLVSLGIMIPFVVPYLSLNPDESRIPITSTVIQYPLLVAHIVTAFIALISGFFQVNEKIRIAAPNIHRNLGNVYLCSVFTSGLLSLVVIFYEENFGRAASFLSLDAVWLFTSWKGWRNAVKKKFREHRKWMIRSFGITLVAVSARAAVPILLLFYLVFNGFSLPGGRDAMVEEVLTVNVWVGLLLDLAIVEWMVLRPRSADRD